MTRRRTRARLLDPNLLGRHQVAAMLASAVDFLTMIALVELGPFSPPVATVGSAMLGGATNLLLSRHWAYRARHEGTFASQASRYALVSFGGALLNGALLAIVLAFVRVPYPAARVVVAVAVSVFYTYPLHTRFVFRVAS